MYKAKSVQPCAKEGSSVEESNLAPSSVMLREKLVPPTPFAVPQLSSQPHRLSMPTGSLFICPSLTAIHCSKTRNSLA